MAILGAETITRITRAAGSRGTDGRYTPGAETSTAISASVQPATGRDLQTLPEGERTRAALRIYTAEALAVGDLVVVDGARYSVRNTAAQRSVLPHTRAIVVATPPEEDPP